MPETNEPKKKKSASWWAGEIAYFVEQNTLYEEGVINLYNTPGLINLVTRIQGDAING